MAPVPPPLPPEVHGIKDDAQMKVFRQLERFAIVTKHGKVHIENSGHRLEVIVTPLRGRPRRFVMSSKFDIPEI